MVWVIQKNLFSENRREDLLNSLERLGIPFFEVDVRNNQIFPELEFEPNTKVITNGSIMLSNIAKARNWNPGSFINENFSYSVWSSYYNDFLLNKNAKTLKIKDVPIVDKDFFVRPVLDNKSFNGKVFSPQELMELKNNSIYNKLGSIHPDTEVILSQPKKIGQEHRHYIVDGEIITSSRYKLSGLPNFSEGADQSVLEKVKEAINIWQPARAFVLDTYISANEIGIVEIGGICHAGLYQSDIIKLVAALDSMDFSINNKLKNPSKNTYN